MIYMTFEILDTNRKLLYIEVLLRENSPQPTSWQETQMLLYYMP